MPFAPKLLPPEKGGHREKRPIQRRAGGSWARSKEVFLPLEFEYGQAFEADWLEVVAEMGGQLVTVKVLAARLRASRASFVKAYPTTQREALFDRPQGAFHFWEYVP